MGVTHPGEWGRARNSRGTWLPAFPGTYHRWGPAGGSARWGRRTRPRWRCRRGHSCSSRGPGRWSRRAWPPSGLSDKVLHFWLIRGHSVKATPWLVPVLRCPSSHHWPPLPPNTCSSEEPLQRASGLRKATVGGESSGFHCFSKVSLRGMTTSRVGGGKEVGCRPSPLLWPEQLHF